MLYCCIFQLSYITALDANMPIYTGREITIQQFAENHFAYEKSLNARTNLIINKKGEWEEDADLNESYVYVEPESREDYTFILDEKGYIREITLVDHWETQSIYCAIPEHCCAAVYAFVGSRPLASFKDFSIIQRLLANSFNCDFEQASTEEGDSGTITINDLIISWAIKLENCKAVQHNYIFTEDGELLRYSFELSMTIAEN